MKPSKLRRTVPWTCTAIAIAVTTACGTSNLPSAPHSTAHSPAPHASPSSHQTASGSSTKKASPDPNERGHVSSTATTKTAANPRAGTYHPVKRPGQVVAKRISGRHGTFVSPVRYRDGLSLAVTKIAQGVESGHAPGDFYGRHDTLLTIRLTNGTHKAINLEQVVVQMTYGSPARVAPPVYDDSKTRDFAAIVRPGHSAKAVYAFAVPTKQRGAVTMRVDFDGLHTVAKFAGSVK